MRKPYFIRTGSILYCEKRIDRLCLKASTRMNWNERTKALSMMQNNKSPGSDGLTTEFYRAFWDIISTYVVNSFNYAFNTVNLSISQRQGIISLIPKKKRVPSISKTGDL